MLSKLLNTFVTSLILISLSSPAWAQKVLEETVAAPAVNPNANNDLITETITRISPSRRIFIITNKSQQLNPGDYISFVTSNELASRAIVAKKEGDYIGTKILKVYSPDKWQKLGPRTQVQIIRGDDSFFNKREEKVKESGKAETEDDLYNDTTLIDGDIVVEENSKRALKTDNIISLLYGQISGLNNDGSSQRYSHFSAAWMYQVADNFWGEFAYGQTTMNGFPQEQIDTKLTSIVLRMKYTFAAPLFTFVQPYFGYQFRSASSPGAGQPGDNLSDAELAHEKALVSQLEKNSVVFGITVLKRLVPGWFARLDLGSDILNAGLALEF